MSLSTDLIIHASDLQVKVADPSVLSYHCCIDYIELEGARITPAVGTHIIVNGKETTQPIMLQNGDTIRLGNKMLRVDVRRILPTRENEEAPQPLLVDMITPPRVTKMTVRPKTQCKSLLSSTKPPVVAVSKKAEDSPVKRQLFSDDDNEKHNNENKKPVPVRNTRKTKAKTAAVKNTGKGTTGRGGKETAAKKMTEKKAVKKLAEGVDAMETAAAAATRRSTRKTTTATATSGQALGETLVRKSVRFASKTRG